MARTRKKVNLTKQQQLARGPVDLPFLMLVVMLLAIGLIMLFSASYVTGAQYAKYDNDPFYFIKRQAVFAVLGLVVMYLISRIDYQFWRLLSVGVLAAAFVLLILVLVPGVGVNLNGSTRWLRIALVAGPTYQPSEVAKLGVILFFSARLSKRTGQPYQFKRKLSQPWESIRGWANRTGLLELLPYGIILILIAGLMVMEPHMSGTILILAGGAAILFAAGCNWKWFVGAIGVGGAGLWLIATKTNYMSARIAAWQDPWNAETSSSSTYQLIQSLYAVGSGGLLGRGLGQSVQKYLYLPEAYNDFIFAIVCEELGYVGALLIILLFICLIVRGYWLALHARDRFGQLLVIGITTLLATQVFLNMAVVTNLIPTTGISLPFFSYGGTALVIQLAEMGIILAVSRQIAAPKQG